MKNHLCRPIYTPDLVLGLFDETAHIFDALEMGFIIPPNAEIFFISAKKVMFNFGIAIQTMSDGYTYAEDPETLYRALKPINNTMKEFYELICNDYSPLPPKFCTEMEMPIAVKKPTKSKDLNHVTHYFFNPETFAGMYEK